MLDFYNNNTKNFLDEYNIFSNTEENIIKISSLYNEIYSDSFSDTELSDILTDSIIELDTFNEYLFIDISNNKETSIFDICISSKEIINWDNDEYNGYIYSYNDNIWLWQILRKYRIYNIDNNEIIWNEKIDLANKLWAFIQHNFFLHLFRSFFVSKTWKIISAFHLRFFNKFELYKMANESTIWNTILNNINKINNPKFLEKVDGQLLMFYNHEWKTFLQSKWSAILIDRILSNDYDKNWIFGNIIQLYKEAWINISILDTMSFNNPHIIYHFEFLGNTNPIVQEYKHPWLFLLGWRDKNSFSSLLETKWSYYNFKKSYNDLYESTNNEDSEYNLIFDIVLGDSEDDIEYKIQKERSNLVWSHTDYVIEGYIEVVWNIFLKIKSTQYFIKKLMKAFSIKRTTEILKAIKWLLTKDIKQLQDISLEILKDWNVFNNVYISKMLDKVWTLKRNQKLKISYIRFLKFIIVNYDETKNWNMFLYIQKNKKEFIDEYKTFLWMSFINVVWGMLTSDTEEISELHEILDISFDELDLNSETLKKDVKNIIINKVKFDDTDNYFINNIKYIIDNINDVEVNI